MKYIRILMLLAIIAFLSLPLFFFPPQLPNEILIGTDWVRDERESASPVSAGDGEWVPLASGTTVLFARPEGDISSVIEREFSLAYNQHGYFNSSQYHDVLVFLSPLDDILYSIESRGFPVLLKNSLALLDADGFGFGILPLTSSGQLPAPDRSSAGISGSSGLLFHRRWSSMPSVIRDIQFQDRQLYITGLLDGRLLVLDEQGGQVAGAQYSSQSAYQLIYGATEYIDHALTQEAEDRLIIVSVHGYAPAILSIHELIFGDSQVAQMQELGSVELPLQYTGTVDISAEPNDVGDLILSVSGEQGVVLVSFDGDGSVFEVIDRDDNSHTLRLLQNDISSGTLWTFRSGEDVSEFRAEFSGGQLLFERVLPFSADFSMVGNRLYVRAAGKVSSYILEQG